MAATREAPQGSWTEEVVAMPQEGGRYLADLALWFERFPSPSPKDYVELKTRLESFVRTDHLGAVNELAWYEFMRQGGFQAMPIATTSAPRPDFRVTSPIDAFVEVSTLNPSDAEQLALKATGGVNLDHGETFRRLVLKASTEKKAQLQYAEDEARPCLLVLFDYTIWSGLATECCRYLATALLEKKTFTGLPASLSAIAYVERRVFDGHNRLSLRRSAIYHNPKARYPRTTPAR
jgi:hypothetical protein